MAKATRVIHRTEPSEEEAREREWKQLEATLLQNKEAVSDALKLMNQFRDKEIFNILHALFAEGDQVLERVVTAIDGSDATKSMKNTLLLFDVLGKFNVEELEPILLKLNTAVSRVAAYEHYGKEGGGYPALLGSLKDPEVIEGMNVLMIFLKGFGVNQEDREKMTPELAKQQHEREKRVQKSDDKQSASSSKWYAVAAGVSLLVTLPWFFKK
ncbi:uncharacterized protein YjgD (DUF1641 family) [Virgibacillus natechei]|uniref:Uncharacterized protein YjgD (DUF1641 family) n=1 Tax=Virgibacillus natechei TaxID=1216297 RepID=A0ABS4IG43_9BACI|nr:DUF1641 domain-containing protein [Virgibacillus natechei]MBP1969903.1 uncharacterized protein YjgD (DUF1641 family) [Virgibacillus natechei]UZD13432.1 DUF1641 domain-containing protein [Virgibacillus natechei]